jgi:hypothetical protein
MKPRITPHVVAVALMFGLSACTNPYDPVQRFIGGGLIGAGSGAAIGAAAAGGHGAALGAAIGGAVGAVGGLITTPPPPAHYADYNHRHYGYYSHHQYARYNGQNITVLIADRPYRRSPTDTESKGPPGVRFGGDTRPTIFVLLGTAPNSLTTARVNRDRRDI